MQVPSTKKYKTWPLQSCRHKSVSSVMMKTSQDEQIAISYASFSMCGLRSARIVARNTRKGQALKMSEARLISEIRITSHYYCKVGSLSELICETTHGLFDRPFRRQYLIRNRTRRTRLNCTGRGRECFYFFRQRAARCLSSTAIILIHTGRYD